MRRVAILIDGGYYLKQLPHVRPDINAKNPVAVAETVYELVRLHLAPLSKVEEKWLSPVESKKYPKYIMRPHWYAQHHRTLFYDARPFAGDVTKPITKSMHNFADDKVAQFRESLFKKLKKQRNLALRLGRCSVSDPEWQINPKVMAAFLNGERTLEGLTDDDFSPAIRQKGVDMRIGLDLASMVLKKQADVFVIIAGDADFVPAVKMARREGCHVILDPLWGSIAGDLREHNDAIYSVFPKPKNLGSKRR